MTPKAEEIINSVNYLNEFEEKYYNVIKVEYDKLIVHDGMLDEKQQKKLDKLKEQELFLSGMIKNLRSLVELSITDEIDKENFVIEADKLMLIKDGKFRTNLIPMQVDFLTNYYNLKKEEINART